MLTKYATNPTTEWVVPPQSTSRQSNDLLQLFAGNSNDTTPITTNRQELAQAIGEMFLAHRGNRNGGQANQGQRNNAPKSNNRRSNTRNNNSNQQRNSGRTYNQNQRLGIKNRHESRNGAGSFSTWVFDHNNESNAD